jgi:hypothetical protein
VQLDSCPHIHLICNSKWNPQTINLASIRSVEAEDSITGDGDDNGVEPDLSQISCVYSYTAMVESLHNIYNPNNERSISATMTDVPGQRMFISKDRHSAVTPEQLSEQWNIGLTQSKQTLRVTTQQGVRSAILPLS